MHDGSVCVNELCDKFKQCTYFNTTSKHMDSSHRPVLIALTEKVWFFFSCFKTLFCRKSMFLAQKYNPEINAQEKGPTSWKLFLIF